MTEKEGWVQYERAHFIVRSKRFWNHYPPDSHGGYVEREGYYYTWKSLCGRESFVAPTSRKIKFADENNLENVCTQCFQSLERKGKLADVDLTFKPKELVIQ